MMSSKKLWGKGSASPNQVNLKAAPRTRKVARQNGPARGTERGRSLYRIRTSGRLVS